MNKDRTNNNHKKRVHVSTLGCSKNLYDSEILMGQLRANKVPLISDPYHADVIIVNTCGFIAPAKQESIDAILEAGEIKKQRPGTRLLVCGCLSRRYRKELRREIREVDEYFGTEDFANIMNYLDLEARPPGHLYEDRLLSDKSHYAFVKISEGCNHKCAFCAIPLMRGRHRSRPMDEILQEARLLAQQDVKEIILIAQDTTFYGLDLYKKQRLVELIQKLEETPGLEWIRIHYAYPTTFQSELMEVIANSEKIVHYVDLPVQHISDSMLKIMKRGGKSHGIGRILSKLQKRIPDIALRTTLLVGHPGEREEDFGELKDFVEEYRFDRLGVFTYSPEEKTAAWKLPYPPHKLAKERAAEIMQIQQRISHQKNLQKIGSIYRVLIDEYDPATQTAVGRTYADSPEIDNEVILEALEKPVKPGTFYSVKITSAGEYEIYGKIWRNNENR